MQLLFEIKLKMNVYFRLQSNASSNTGNWLLFFYSLKNKKKSAFQFKFKIENHNSNHKTKVENIRSICSLRFLYIMYCITSSLYRLVGPRVTGRISQTRLITLKNKRLY